MSHSNGTIQPHRARRRWLLGAFAVGILALSSVAVACDDDDDDGADTTPTLTGTATLPGGTTPTTPAMTATTPAGTPTADSTATPTGSADLPQNAQDYAEAVFDAWADGDMDQLEQLATDEVVAVLATTEYDDADGWAMAGCDAGTGQVACSFESATGETLEVLIDNQMASMGEPQAAIEARFV